ncbi:DUF2793 domain-containing protein [Sphingomonas sp. RS6]
MTSSPTPRLALPLIEPGQAQKEMAHNEALARIDIAVHTSIVAAHINTPPDAPLPGQCWLVGPSPTGAWASQAGCIAGWTEGGWRFVAPVEGMRAWLGRDGGWAVFAAGAWRLGEVHGRLIVEGKQLIGARAPAIAEPNGGVTVDAEARSTLSAVLQMLRTHGLIEAG